MGGWRRLEELTLPLAYTEIHTTTAEISDPSDPRAGKGAFFLTKVVAHVWLSADAGKVISDYYDDSGKWVGGSAAGFNPDYAFRASRSDEHGPYTITHIGSDELARNVVKQALLQASGVCRSPEQLIALSTGFTVTSCRDVKDGGPSLVDVDVSYPPPTTSEAKFDPTTRSCELLMDAAADWRPTKEVYRRDNFETTVNLTYVPQSPDFTALSKVVVKYKLGTAEKPMAVQTQTYELSEWSHAPIAASEFRLPSIGIPESVGSPTSKPTKPATQGASSIGE
jgi:hypothetical protein